MEKLVSKFQSGNPIEPINTVADQLAPIRNYVRTRAKLVKKDINKKDAKQKKVKIDEFVENLPTFKSKNIVVPQDKTYIMLRDREAAKDVPNRWGYLDKSTGVLTISIGATPVAQTRVISGTTRSDAGVSGPIFSNLVKQEGSKFAYSYLSNSNLATTPGGILVIRNFFPSSKYGKSEDFTRSKDYNIYDEYGQIVDYAGEPIIQLNFAGQNTRLANAFHASPKEESNDQFNNRNVKYGSTGCVRLPDWTLRYIYNNGLLRQLDTIFSKPEMNGNYLYIDDKNKVQMHVGNKTNSKEGISIFQTEY